MTHNDVSNICFAIILSGIPEPSNDDIRVEMEADRMRNPHNDAHKPERRSRNFIIAELKNKQAKELFKIWQEQSQ